MRRMRRSGLARAEVSARFTAVTVFPSPDSAEVKATSRIGRCSRSRSSR